MKKKGFTLIELLVVIAIIAMLLAVLMPALSKVKTTAQRLVCSSNLRGLGASIKVYGNEYDDRGPVQGGKGSFLWGRVSVRSDDSPLWYDPDFNWEAWAAGGNTGDLTVGASLYLLVRDADVDPKVFICKGGDEKPYGGENPYTVRDLQLVELWDFGGYDVIEGDEEGVGPEHGPGRHVSYAYQMPYDLKPGITPAEKLISAYPASASGSSSMAVMADKNPWFDPRLRVGLADDEDQAMRFVNLINSRNAGWKAVIKYDLIVGNSYNHLREGQNVLFGDSHSEFIKRPDISVKNDNIYTSYRGPGPYGEPIGPEWIEKDIRQGTMPKDGEVGVNRPKSAEDAFLVNDDERD